LPLHGIGNRNGKGKGVRVTAFNVPEDPRSTWEYTTFNTSMHLTHNFDVHGDEAGESIYIGGKEGLQVYTFTQGKWQPDKRAERKIRTRGLSEVRLGRTSDTSTFVTGIEPLHGDALTVYARRYASGMGDKRERVVLDGDLRGGHGLAVADLHGLGREQKVAGRREPNSTCNSGIKLYRPFNEYWEAWRFVRMEQGGIACEDLTVADLDGDGKPDIIAS